jgi:hypothetical protein
VVPAPRTATALIRGKREALWRGRQPQRGSGVTLDGGDPNPNIDSYAWLHAYVFNRRAKRDLHTLQIVNTLGREHDAFRIG